MIIRNDANMSIDSIIKLNTICNNIEMNLDGLNISGFKGINIVSDNLLPLGSDGRTINKMILLPKERMEKYLNNNSFSIIKSTIYHELCHVDIANELPELHFLHSESLNKDDLVTAYTITIFIEYLAQLKSYKYGNDTNRKKYFDSVNNKKWNFNNDDDKVRFIKHAPYIIARDNSNFINKISDNDIKSRLFEIKKEFNNIIKSGLIDDYSILLNLEKIVKNYIKD